MTELLFIFSLCLLASAFFAGSEMAFVTSNKLRMRKKADDGDPAAKKIVTLYSRSQEFLSAILIGNNIVNIVATASLTLLLETYFHVKNEWVTTAVFIPIFLILGEMVPKDLGRQKSEMFLLRTAWLLVWFMGIFKIPTRLIMQTIDRLLGRFRSVLHKNIFVSQNEFRSLIEESTRSGVLDSHERKLINTILDFEKTHIESVMIPLEKAIKVEFTATVGQVKALGKKHSARMVLVYEEIPSIVMGMVYVFDLLFEGEIDQPLKQYLRAPIFLPSTTSIERAFLTLQQKRQSFAVVINENSDAVGVVPIERLIDM